MSDWRPFEQTSENVRAAAELAGGNHCNRHDDCAAADAVVRARSGRTVREGAWGWREETRATHCRVAYCVECAGC